MTDDRSGARPPGSPQERLAALRGATAQVDNKLAGETTSGSAAQPSGDQPAPPPDLAAETAHPPTTGHKVWLVLGLTVMTGLASVPLLLGLWILASVFGVVVIAEALERTRGLVPTTYGGAFWLAVVFVALLILLEIATWIPRGVDKTRAHGGCLMALLTRPALAAVVLLLPTVFLVRCDLRGTDLPDILTTTALLCLLGYGLFVLPIAFVASSIRFARWLWRIGSRSSFRSGLIAGIATVLGAIMPLRSSCAPPDPEGEADDAFDIAIEHGADVLDEELERRGLVDGSLAALTRAASVIPGTSGPWSLPPALAAEDQRDAFDRCVRQLATSSGGRTTVKQAAQWLETYRSADYESANAVAYTTILRVCKVHLREPRGDLEGYYLKSVKQNYTRDYQRDPLRACSPFDDRQGHTDRTDVVLDMRTRLCALDPKDREIVLGTLRGETSAAIGQALDITDANVRQRLSRALKRIAET